MLWLAVEEEKENVRIYAMRVPHNLIEDFNLFGNENGVFYQTLACAMCVRKQTIFGYEFSIVPNADAEIYSTIILSKCYI